MFMGWVQRTLWFAGAIVFIMWLYRAYQNVDATDPGRRRYGYGWAISGWFVPILNFWRPKQIVNDIWRAGQNPGDPGFLLIAWWLLWIANGFVSSSARRHLQQRRHARGVAERDHPLPRRGRRSARSPRCSPCSS